MKFYITPILLFLSLMGLGQNWRINNLIEKLNNNQFVIDHSHKALFKTKSAAADKLIKIGMPATTKLIAALENPNKNIMAHLILCHIYFKHASFAGPKEHTVNQQTKYIYFLGQEKGEGLLITETKEKNIYKLYVEEKNKQDIIAFWKNVSKK